MKPPHQDRESCTPTDGGTAKPKDPIVRCLEELESIGWTLLTVAILKDLCPLLSRWVMWIIAIGIAPLLPAARNLIESFLDAHSSKRTKRTQP
jgi:hypothetical protein